MEKYYLGLDIGTKWVYAALTDDKGNLLSGGKLPLREEAIDLFIKHIPKENIDATMEACGIWYPLYDYLRTRCNRVAVANPIKTK